MSFFFAFCAQIQPDIRAACKKSPLQLYGFVQEGWIGTIYQERTCRKAACGQRGSERS